MRLRIFRSPVTAMLMSWRKLFMAQKPIDGSPAGGTDALRRCTACGHSLSPDYVWLAALVQVSPASGTCSATNEPQEKCGCDLGGHSTLGSK